MPFWAPISLCDCGEHKREPDWPSTISLKHWQRTYDLEPKDFSFPDPIKTLK